MKHGTPMIATRFGRWMALTLIALASQACGGSGDSGSGAYSVDPRNCSAPKFDTELQASLCEADEVAFSNRIRRSWESPDLAERKRAVEILERVWHLDPQLGIGLPLKALDRDDFRAVVAEFLSQAIRSGFSDEPLSNLQEFAAHFSRSHRDDDRTAVAVKIIGFTDSVAQLPFVIQTVQSNAGGARRSAIVALGDICSPEAAKFLVALQEPTSGHTAEEKRLAGLALRERNQGAPASWCKRSLPSTTREKII